MSKKKPVPASRLKKPKPDSIIESTPKLHVDAKMADMLSNAATVATVKELLTAWIAKRGHDRCWHQPEIFTELCLAVGLPIPTMTHDLTREEFASGCARYQDELYGPTIGGAASGVQNPVPGRPNMPDPVQTNVAAPVTVSTRRRVGWVGPDFFRSSADTGGAVFGVVHNSPRMVGGEPAPGETYVEVREVRRP